MERPKLVPARRLRRLVVPAVLTVAVIAGAAAAISTTTGCGDNSPAADGSTDATPDTPIL